MLRRWLKGLFAAAASAFPARSYDLPNIGALVRIFWDVASARPTNKPRPPGEIQKVERHVANSLMILLVQSHMSHFEKPFRVRDLQSKDLIMESCRHSSVGIISGLQAAGSVALVPFATGHC